MRTHMMRKALLAGLGAAVIGISACEDPNGPDNGTPVAITWSGCTGAALPAWMAVQDGDGSWTRVTPTGNVFSFTISSGRGGIATYSPDDGLYVQYLATEEMQATL